MRKILFIILVLIGVQSQAQRLQYVNNYGMEFQRLLVDTSLGLPIDTFTVPVSYNKRAWLAAKGNTLYLWDTTLLKWSAFAGGGGSGTVTSVATGYGLSGGTITTSGTLLVDSAFIATRLRLQKVGDSLAALIAGAGGSPGGSNTQYQYNNSSAFGGTNMTYNNSTGATTLTGSSNTPQFKILAHSGQTNANPIFRLRTSADGDLLDIHSDYYTNFFAGVDAGTSNTFVLSTSGYDNTFTGYSAGNKNTTGYLNTYYGKRSGANNISGANNTMIGAGAGQNNLMSNNINIGYHSGFGNKHGANNVIIGTEAAYADSSMNTSTIVGRQAALNGYNMTGVSIFGFQSGLSGSGAFNSYFGSQSGYSNLTGSSNTLFGTSAGYSILGSGNVIMGTQAGENATGSTNVFIGYQAGRNSGSRSNRLMIDNSSTNNPLIDGDFAADTLTVNGSMGVGAAPVASSILNLSSTTKGFLTPRMTATQRTSISSPATGLEVYDTDSLKKFVYNGSAWKSLANTTDIPAVSTPTLQQVLTAGPDLTTDHALDFDGNDFSIDGGNVISIASNGAGIGGQRVDFSAANSTNGQDSRVEIYGDSIIVKPGTGGVISIDSLRTLAAGDDEMMTWNPRTGVVSHQAIPSGGGGTYVDGGSFSTSTNYLTLTQTGSSPDIGIRIPPSYLLNPVNADSLVFQRNDSVGIVKAVSVVAATTDLTVTPTRTDSTISFSIAVNEGNLSGIPQSAVTNLTTDLAAKASISGTETLSNKRWTPRVGSTTSSATPTINTDNVDIYKLTALTTNITSMTTNLSGTPVDGDVLEIQITGTATRTITWGSSFVSSTVTLPTTTVGTATLTIVLQYFTTSSYGNNKWVCASFY